MTADGTITLYETEYHGHTIEITWDTIFHGYSHYVSGPHAARIRSKYNNEPKAPSSTILQRPARLHKAREYAEIYADSIQNFIDKEIVKQTVKTQERYQ